MAFDRISNVDGPRFANDRPGFNIRLDDDNYIDCLGNYFRGIRMLVNKKRRVAGDIRMGSGAVLILLGIDPKPQSG